MLDNNISQALCDEIKTLLNRENRRKRPHDRTTEPIPAASPPQLAALLAAVSTATTPPPHVAHRVDSQSSYSPFQRAEMAQYVVVCERMARYPRGLLSFPPLRLIFSEWNIQGESQH